MQKTYLISIEPYYYGKRLKAEIKTITNIKDNTRTYTAYLYTHGKELIKTKTFFNYSYTNLIEQNKEYIKAYNFVQEYLNTCKY